VWSVNDGLARKSAGNLRKTAAAVSSRFPIFFYASFFKKNLFMKKCRNLLKTAAAGFRRYPEVSGNFQRFPDNP
jgi:hypothetical protein